MVKKLPRKTAEWTRQAMIDLFEPLPLSLRRTLTLDNGCEFTRHSEFTKTLNMPVYFARPYHSWERGSNENGNGMIRRYFPKGTNFDHISEEQIQTVVNQINARPRKILGYRSADQVFREHFPLSTN
jgi:transposase, IS30 family